MVPFRLKTKYFKLEIFRRGLVFTIASLIFASGVNLVNGNIFLAFLSIFNKQVFNEDSNEYGFWVGLFLILLSLFLFYLIIINWRIEIYSKTFVQLRRCLDKYGTAINHRAHYENSEKLRKLHTEAYKEYTKTVEFLNENQTNLDVKTYNSAVNLNYKIGQKFIELDVYIKELNKIENNIATPYNPQLANKELPREINELKDELHNFVQLIKEKEKFKISNKN
jgi:hypothetical protein